MADNLTARIQSLPPELFNMIRAEAIVFHRGDVDYERITRGYKFPKQLHIDKASRIQSAEAYFHNTTFIFVEPRICCQFLEQVEDTHFAAMGSFYIIKEEQRATGAALEAIRYVQRRAMKTGVQVSPTYRGKERNILSELGESQRSAFAVLRKVELRDERMGEA